jgi:hypothetical protein
MKKLLFWGLALLASSGLMAAISLSLAVLLLDTLFATHDQYLWTRHASHVTWYAAVVLQMIGAWLTWRGLPVPRSRYVAAIVVCDLGAILVLAWFLIDSRWIWAIVRSRA